MNKTPLKRASFVISLRDSNPTVSSLFLKYRSACNATTDPIDSIFDHDAKLERIDSQKCNERATQRALAKRSLRSLSHHRYKYTTRWFYLYKCVSRCQLPIKPENNSSSYLYSLQQSKRKCETWNWCPRWFLPPGAEREPISRKRETIVIRSCWFFLTDARSEPADWKKPGDIFQRNQISHFYIFQICIDRGYPKCPRQHRKWKKLIISVENRHVELSILKISIFVKQFDSNVTNYIININLDNWDLYI